MFSLQNCNTQVMLAPGALTSGGTNTTGVVDMLDYGEVLVAVSVASTTTSAVPVAIVFQESNDLTTYVTITSAGTASTGWVTATEAMGSAATSNTNLTAPYLLWHQPWDSNRRRYLRATITGPTANTMSATILAIKSRAAKVPTGTSVGGTYVSTSVGNTLVVAPA